MHSGGRISLDLSRVKLFPQLAWLALACTVIDRSGPRIAGLIRARGLLPEVRTVVGRRAGRWPMETCGPGEAVAVPGPDAAFAFVTGARGFTVKLVMAFDRVHVEPTETVAPGEIDPRVFWPDLGAGFLARLEWLVAATAVPALKTELKRFHERIGAGERTVSLLTSVFSGDEFLHGFLNNMAVLDEYGKCEHFLVRPGSPGTEHDQLMDHVRNWPSAVYVNLPEDPGLYATWNLAARLSTAPYLSNANLDDRRAPAHVATLSRRLDADPDIDVVSAALRVTDTPNLPWTASAGCDVWYGEAGGSTYMAEELLRPRDGGFVSHNRPHCMPLWRRWLHVAHGWFDERSDGPSADWAFWLRVGVAGSRFGLVSEPLGLYLRNPDSYWRNAADPAADDSWDARIVARYAPALREGATFESSPEPFALAIRTLRELAACGAWLEFVVHLAGLVERSDAMPESAAARRLVDWVLWHYIGIDGVAFRADPAWLDRPAAPGTRADAAHLLTGLFRRRFAETVSGPAGSRSERVLTGAAVDFYTVTGRPEALVLLALYRRRRGESACERDLLASIHRRHGAAFWPALQAVYRFDAAADEVAHRLGLARTPADAPALDHPGLRLWFFPDFTDSNVYQDSLYAEIRAGGARVEGLSEPEELESLAPDPAAACSVLHLHWINALFRGVVPENFDARAEAALALLTRVRERGIALYWTLHNALSHESPDPEAERDFRTRLARLADRVYVHHPMARDLLDWLPADVPVWLTEHGPYDPGEAGRTSAGDARSRLGLPQDAFVLVCPGKVRDYKGLEMYLPAIRKAMEARSNLWFVVAGQLAARAPRSELKRLPQERLVVVNRFLPAGEMALYIRAADFALLSYRRVLTSGALFHAFSLGVPVLAPRLGTIPAYLVDGWNGYGYGDATELEQRLRALTRVPVPDRLGANAAFVAGSLRWRF